MASDRILQFPEVVPRIGQTVQVLDYDGTLTEGEVLNRGTDKGQKTFWVTVKWPIDAPAEGNQATGERFFSITPNATHATGTNESKSWRGQYNGSPNDRAVGFYPLN